MPHGLKCSLWWISKSVLTALIRWTVTSAVDNFIVLLPPSDDSADEDVLNKKPRFFSFFEKHHFADFCLNHNKSSLWPKLLFFGFCGVWRSFAKKKMIKLDYAEKNFSTTLSKHLIERLE